MTNNRIIVIVGFSACGKDTQAQLIKDNLGYDFIASASTRPMRKGESQGNPYLFISKEEMFNLQKNDKLVECRSYNTILNGTPDTWYYAVRKEDVKDNKSYVVVLDIEGLRDFKKVYGNRVISVFIEVDEPIRKQRCIDRHDFDVVEWNRRYEDDKVRFPKEIITNEVDIIIEANKLDIEQLHGVIVEEIDWLETLEEIGDRK